MKRFLSKNYLKTLSQNTTTEASQQYKLNRFKHSIESFNALRKDEVRLQRAELETHKNNRQFITEVFYEALDEGLRKMRALNPSDPFEFLVSSKVAFHRAKGG